MKYTEKEFIEAVESSNNIRQVLDKLNLKPAGGNYKTVHNLVDKFKLDISHYTAKGSNKGKKFGPKRPIEDYLSNKQSIQSFKLKKRLIKEEILKPICSNCDRKDWEGKPIPLELDHINGKHKDNTLSNLRLLCPNCHALTPTYRGKNKK